MYIPIFVQLTAYQPPKEGGDKPELTPLHVNMNHVTSISFSKSPDFGMVTSLAVPMGFYLVKETPQFIFDEIAKINADLSSKEQT